MNKRNRRGKRALRPQGMTLIEMLIVIALSAIILIALLSFYVEGQKYFYNQNSRADTIEESRIPMAWISKDIREAANVVSGPVTAYDGKSYSTGEDCIVLDVPSIDGAGMIIGGVWDRIIYYYDDTNHRLVKLVSPVAGVRQNDRSILAENLFRDANGQSPFRMKYFRSDGATEVTPPYEDATNGAFIVEVELTAQGRSILRSGQPFVETVRSQAKLRNKVVPS